ncbi:MAG TPA: DnaJ domain-containing protein [Candidatus Dorea intestinavium]|nr:DnaJ domain-containing protein [Candidatus Dorea intestinavium]
MNDPYSVLGVSKEASLEEVTAAYRKLARKYHPDINPGDKLAEEKMRQINAAYDQIKTGQTGGASYEQPDGSYTTQSEYNAQRGAYGGEGAYGSYNFDDLFGSFFTGGGDPLSQVEFYINRGQYQYAGQVLAQIKNRNARWYYLGARANAGAGNQVSALNYINEAVRLEPANIEYQQLLQQFKEGNYNYRDVGSRSGYNMENMGRSFLNILLMQLFCCFCCRPF